MKSYRLMSVIQSDGRRKGLRDISADEGSKLVAQGTAHCVYQRKHGREIKIRNGLPVIVRFEALIDNPQVERNTGKVTTLNQARGYEPIKWEARVPVSFKSVYQWRNCAQHENPTL